MLRWKTKKGYKVSGLIDALKLQSTVTSLHERTMRWTWVICAKTQDLSRSRGVIREVVDELTLTGEEVTIMLTTFLKTDWHGRFFVLLHDANGSESTMQL